MKNKIIFTIGLITLALFFYSPVFAADVSLTIRDGDAFVFQTANVPIQPGDTVLTVLNNADQADPSWNISDLQHYSFGDYIKCITSPAGNHCDNWQYTVNGSYPLASVDQNTVSVNDVIYLYFGPQNRILLSSPNINTNDTLTVTAQKYSYQDNTWATRAGVTAGLTQANPSDPFSPIEIQTSAVDANGQAIFSAIPVGSYNVGVKEDFYFPTEALMVKTPPAPTGGGIIFNPPVQIKPKFDLEKALGFITSQQKENGSFSDDLYTDWTALSLSSSENFQDQKTKLAKYFGGLKTDDYQLTDYERHAMALMALGMNPYNISGENYIKKITDSFDGKQFGDANKDNDDIFALIVLQNAGFIQTEKIMSDDISFVLSEQKENGSWDYSVDMTGAGIEALAPFSQDVQVKSALIKAEEFLRHSWNDNGGWGNNSSTAWAIEGILALSEKPEDWVKNNNTPLDYLAANQDTDGGMKNDDENSKLWETAYVATALSGKTWNQIMQKFEKPPEVPAPQKTEITKKVAGKTAQTAKKIKPKKEIQKSENLSNQNTATVINSLQTKNPEPIKKSWFRNLLDKIFSIF